MTLSDQHLRERFCTELDTNFSVLAPAGVGKTHAIVNRAVNFLERKLVNPKSLGSLVVVTYTRKAAREMEERARMLATEKGLPSAKAFSHVFFGTIHSFCFELISRFSHFIGLDSKLEPVANENALWLDFLTDAQSWENLLPTDFYQKLGRFVDLMDILETAHKLPSDIFCPSELPFPELDFSPIFNFVPENKRVIASVELMQRRLMDWIHDFHYGAGVVPFPECTRGGAPFIELWNATWAPIKNWAANESLRLSLALGEGYERYRLENGKLRYDDMVNGVRRLLAHPQASAELSANDYHIILDEAQDTDEAQFECLLGLSNQADAGRFSMVGDPQQAIYSSRASFTTYIDLHKKLIAENRATELAFEVTFRCGKEVVNLVNHWFPHVLDGKNQVEFSKLDSPSEIHSGQFVCIPLKEPADFDRDGLVDVCAKASAKAFAEWLSQQDLAHLRARDWNQVAVLCPRSTWLNTLKEALENVGFKCELRLSQAKRFDLRLGSIAGIAEIIANPKNAFELAGILFAVLGIDQKELECYPYPLNLVGTILGNGSLADALKKLQDLRTRVLELPLERGLELILDELELDAPPSVFIQASLLCDASWSDFSEVLSKLSSGDEQAPLPGHIQLLTSHAAKGLEWDAVLAPMFFRPIAFRHETYPRVLHSPALKKSSLQLDANHQHEALQLALIEARHAELERLLYVTLTRARHTVALFNDRGFWRNSESCFAYYGGVLNLEHPNRAVWRELLSELTPEKVIASRVKETSVFEERSIEKLQFCAVDNFPKRLLPSATESHKIGEPLSIQISADGPLYGQSWHAVMQSCPWKDADAWQSHWDERKSIFPDVARAEREWNLFCKSDFALELKKGNVCVHTEVPMLSVLSQEYVAEGVIDCLIVFSGEHGLWLVDWKTDRVGTDYAEILLQRYRVQIDLYSRAIKMQQPDVEVKSFLYSTVWGKLIQCV
jgi:ATP-dependent helicase/nuclease subunit A